MSYTKTNWQNTPSTQTPISAANLNHMEQGIYDAAQTADSAQSGVDALDPRMDLVEERLDNLIPQGTPTEGNAELIDIRVGANGVTYPDAGSAVRGQYTQLKSALSDINYIISSVTDNKYIDTTDGSEVATLSWAYKTYDVEGLDGQSATIHTKLYNGSVGGWVVVLKDGTISLSGTSADANVTLPTDCKYVKISCYKPSLTADKIGFVCNFSAQLARKNEIPNIEPLEDSVYTETTVLYANYKDTWEHARLNSSGGTDATNGWRVSGYEKLLSASQVHVKLSMYEDVYYVAFYNTSKTFISGVASTVTNNSSNPYTEVDLTIPSNAEFFRLSFRADNDTYYGNQQYTIKNEKVEIVDNKVNDIIRESKITARVLILGDSYSANTDKWIAPMMETFSADSSYISLAVSSATVKDQNNDRTTYPYTSRPKSTNTTPNTNTLSCQIAKLKRLMEGTDLDEGETAIYQTADEYPNVIIIQGGENDWKDASTSAYNDQFEVKVDNVYYSRWGTVSQGSVYLKPDIENVNRTIFAGAYRYLMEELYALFPHAQYFFTTTSPVAPHQNPVLSLRREIAEQQRLCANMCCVSVIDWQSESQMSIIVNSVSSGNGTQASPYVVTPATQDSTDGLHPSEYGGKKLGKLAASVINSRFMHLS